MEEIYEYFENLGIETYKLDKIVNETTGEIDNIFVNANDLVYYSITGPHSGNGFTFLVRADAAASHDRWSNCDWEYNFEDVTQVKTFFEVGGLSKVAQWVLSTVEYAMDMATYLADQVTGVMTEYWRERNENNNN